MKSTIKAVNIALCLTFLLSACGAPSQRVIRVQEDPNITWRASHGRVERIEQIESGGETTGGGAVAGGVIGGVAGHQIGGGRGNDAATVVGAIAGAIIGNAVERNNTQVQYFYRIYVHLDNGDRRIFRQERINGMQAGDRVSIDRGRVVRD
ncbi:MAG: glycine zipper 2TM domain-containing protein [Pseudomonadota bacterium]